MAGSRWAVVFKGHRACCSIRLDPSVQVDVLSVSSLELNTEYESRAKLDLMLTET